MAPETERLDVGGEGVVVRRMESDYEAEVCARLMASSEPWVTLRRGYEESLDMLRDPSREVYVALRVESSEVLGFLIVSMRGAFIGYLQSIAVREDWRGRGLGSRLIAFAERRVFHETPNMFILASSFNERARALYQRLGYEIVGELRDYIVRGHSEWLLRKSIAPLADWTTSRGPLAFHSNRAP